MQLESITQQNVAIVNHSQDISNALDNIMVKILDDVKIIVIVYPIKTN